MKTIGVKDLCRRTITIRQAGHTVCMDVRSDVYRAETFIAVDLSVAEARGLLQALQEAITDAEKQK